MNRLEVYDAIDTERSYQEHGKKDENKPDMINDLHVGDTLTAIRVNLEKAESAWYIGSVPHQESLEYLRKIAALCVQAGEIYGLPKRKP